MKDLPNGRVSAQICDFGLSKDFLLSQAKTCVGNINYRAPEAMVTAGDDQKGEGKYSGFAADIWSCGVMLFALLARAYPFQRNTDSTNLESARANSLYPDLTKVALGPRHLLSRIFVPHVPAAPRPGAAELLEHEWFRDAKPGVRATRRNPSCWRKTDGRCARRSSRRCWTFCRSE